MFLSTNIMISTLLEIISFYLQNAHATYIRKAKCSDTKIICSDNLNVKLYTNTQVQHYAICNANFTFKDIESLKFSRI